MTYWGSHSRQETRRRVTVLAFLSRDWEPEDVAISLSEANTVFTVRGCGGKIERTRCFFAEATRPRSPRSWMACFTFSGVVPVASATALISSESPIPSSTPV